MKSRSRRRGQASRGARPHKWLSGPCGPRRSAEDVGGGEDRVWLQVWQVRSGACISAGVLGGWQAAIDSDDLLSCIRSHWPLPEVDEWPATVGKRVTGRVRGSVTGNLQREAG